MIPFIRSHSELMAITESRDIKKNLYESIDILGSDVASGQSKRYIRSLSEEVTLPSISRKIRRKWKQNKELLSRFICNTDYNNKINSSRDLYLIEKQNGRTLEDVA